MNPITVLGRESQIIHNHITLQKGCPTVKDQNILSEELIKYDKVISSISSLIPSALPLNIVQGVVGPMLIILADDIDRKPANLDLLKEANSQLVNLCNLVVKAQLESLKIELKKEKIIGNLIPKDIEIKHGELDIIIYGKKKTLYEKNDKVYVDGIGKSAVYYDRESEIWKYEDESLNAPERDNVLMEQDSAERSYSDFMSFYQTGYENYEINRVNDAARYYSLRSSNEQRVGVFIAKVLKKSGILSSDEAIKFATNIDVPILNIEMILHQPRRIISTEQLLKVQKGEVLSFISDGQEGQDGHVAHYLVSLGNGRFVGVKNSILTGDVNSEPRFFTAEQLGEMKNNLLTPFHNPKNKFQLYCGYPENSQHSYLFTLKENADKLAESGIGLDISRKISTVLRNSGELSHEQAEAFFQKASIILSGKSANLSVSSFTDTLRYVTPAEFKNVEAGNLIIIQNKSGGVVSMALSLGDGEFLSDNRGRVMSSSKNHDVLSAEKLAELFLPEQYIFIESDISRTKLRLGSLLGKDASFYFSAHSGELTVRAHGAPGNVNMLNPFELADVIRGLLISKGIDIRNIRTINLESCFGAMGLPSMGKALAALLDKRVVAYPYRFSVSGRDNPSSWRVAATTYEPALLATDRESIKAQCRRNYRLMNTLGTMYGYLTRRRFARSDMPFETILTNVARFVLHQLSVEEFIKLQPEYDADLGNTLSLIQTSQLPDTPYDFAERCLDILSLTESTYAQLNASILYENT
ncbi:hypothetical protein EB241_02210 [Erwinia psidii]|uniref:Uncharacterized protein n=2 Tax=Erwinia psidii TaxID=69224 RepID=A0A3N6S3B1_9GAMM|nr:hypothetical protein EB241_02210 [Erwinia psidii]